MIKAFTPIFSPLLHVALVATLFIGGPAAAGEIQRQISVTGEAQVAADPDMATITLGVAYEAKTARSALDATSSATGKVLQRLADFGVAPRDMQTSRLSLTQNRSSRSSSKVGVTGFTASNTVHVRLRDLAIIGQILDAIIDEGGNNFNGLQFSVQDPEPLMKMAREQAVADAIAKARLLTEAANVSLGAVLSMSEQGGGRPKTQQMSAARGGAVPIAAGEVTVSASVTMVFAIEN